MSMYAGNVPTERLDHRALQFASGHRIDVTGHDHPYRRGRARIPLDPYSQMIDVQVDVG
jgi:hypothetical protein